MDKTFFDATAIVRNCEYSTMKAYRNVMLTDSTFGNDISVGDDTIIERSSLEGFTAINRRSYINDSEIGAFTYTGINTIINFSKIGRFCSIGRNVDIGGFNHDYHKMTTMSTERFYQLNGMKKEKKTTDDSGFCKIGSDVWIAAGAHVLHSVEVGNGAVVGAGAIVTRDVPPFSIVVGVPAKIIGYRCDESLIGEMQELRWWDWPIDILRKYGEELTRMDLSVESLNWLKAIKKGYC